MMRTFDVDGYLTQTGEVRVHLRRAHRVPHTGQSVAVALTRDQIQTLISDLQAALDTTAYIGD